MEKKDALNVELLKFHIENPIKKPSVDFIYHYTSPEGLLSILKDQKLWFTRYDCLNDYTEREYIITVFHSVCKKLKNEKEISDSFYEKIIDVEIDKREILSVSNEPFEYDIVDSDYYVCCFSKNRDSLPMWNYYSKNNQFEGYNIEFDIDIVDYNKAQNENCRIEMHEIIYKKKEQERIIKEAILKTYSLSEKYNDFEITKLSLAGYLKKLSLVFKRQCFEHEEEVRMILIIPKDGNEFYPLNYRTSNGCIIPYIEYEFKKRVLLGLTIGPLVNVEASQKTLWQILKQNGYRFDSIEPSDIPIRY